MPACPLAMRSRHHSVVEHRLARNTLVTINHIIILPPQKERWSLTIVPVLKTQAKGGDVTMETHRDRSLLALQVKQFYHPLQCFLGGSESQNQILAVDRHAHASLLIASLPEGSTVLPECLADSLRLMGHLHRVPRQRMFSRASPAPT